MKNNQLVIQYEKTKTLLRSSTAIERFSEVLGNDRIARAYIGSVLLCVSQSEKLMACTPGSIIHAALRAASLQLSVDPSLGHAYLIPFGNVCTFVPGYLGYQALALRTGRYQIINVATIYEGQSVEEDQLTGVHKIKGLPSYDKEKWVAIGYLLYFKLKDGYSKSFYMDIDQLKEHGERYSKTWKRPDSLWHTNSEAMYKKTVMRLGLKKFGYFNPSDSLALADSMDEEIENNYDTVEAEWIEQAEQEQAEKQAELAGKSTDELSAMLGFEDVPTSEQKKEWVDAKKEIPSQEYAEPVAKKPMNKSQPETLVEAAQELGGVVKNSMSLETAENMVDSKGSRYGDMTNDELSGYSIGIGKLLAKNELMPEKHDEYQMKLDAIGIILASRNK